MHPDGHRIGKYDLQQYLGGGMADVYRAYDTVIGRTVAVKILKKEFCGENEARLRFLQEARLAGNLHHDNVVRIYDFGEDEIRRPFMVMEFLEGQDLARAVASSTPGDDGRKLSIAIEVASALEYIHSQGIIHRDIKPQNILLTSSGKAKLMDFGIARAADLGLTQAGATMGTPAYMAPEQVRGEKASVSVDVYAFGILLYEVFTGARAFVADTIDRLFYMVLQEPVQAAKLQECQAPPALVNLILRCVAKNAQDRPADMAAVRQELERIRASLERARAVGSGSGAAAQPAAIPAQTVSPARDTARRAPAFKTVWIAVAAVAVMAIAGVALYFKTGEEPAVVPAPVVSHPQQIQTPTGAMNLVPGGPFLFGKDKVEQTLPPFYVDQTEVTNSAWEQFTRATGRPLPEGHRSDQPSHPVSGITFADALAFAAWAGKRLPTSAEWEKAARGTDGRQYPWGNETKTAAVVNTSGPVAAGTYYEYASPFGAVHMAGNMWEFLNEEAEPAAETVKAFSVLTPPPGAPNGWIVIRGGSWKEPLDPNVLSDYTPVPVWFSSSNIGFRCVKSAD